MRQIRDVINVRRHEILMRDLSYKEIEVRAITGAIHAAAGNQRGMAHSQSFSFHEKPVGQASERQIRSLVGAPDGEGEFTMEQIAARAAELTAAA